MVIYKLTNILNGKIYVGQTIQDLKERWYGHCKAISKCTAIARALKKYGKHNFTIEQIDRADNLEDLNKKEVEWIAKLRSNTKGIGYNLTTGGMNAIPSEETKQKMRGPRPMISMKMTGRKPSEETKKKMSEARKNSPHLAKVEEPVLCVEINTVYKSLSEAARSLNISVSNICNVVKGKRKSAGGYTFMYIKGAKYE